MIPLPLFFAKPPKDQVRLSPLGTFLGYRSRDKDTGVLNLWIQDRATGKERQITFDQERDVCLVYWFSYDDKTILYLREPSKNGSELYHIYAIDLELVEEENDGTNTSTGKSNSSNINKGPRDLIQDKNVTCAMGFAGGLQFWLDPQQPRHVYTATAPCGIRSMFWSISCIHLDSGECRIVEQNPLATWLGLVFFVICTAVSVVLKALGVSSIPQPRATVQWFPDANMDFRGRMEISLVDLSGAWRVRESEDESSTTQENWKTYFEVTWANVNMSLVGSSGGSGTAHIDYSEDGSTVDLHICSSAADTTSYNRYDSATTDHLQQLACHPKSDINGFLRDPRNGKVQGVKYNYEKPTIELLGGCPEGIQRDVEFLKAQFTDAVFSIVSRTLDDRTWLVHAQSDVGLPLAQNAPSGYFVLNRTSQNIDGGSNNNLPSLEFILSPQSDLTNHKLGTMIPVHIPARDGEDLLCYLSRSPSVTNENPRDPTPLVLLIHGGPQARDVWQYNPLCQLLVSRGTSVLQVNYRGSTGLGTRFVKLGMSGAFAAGVQEDIQDAANYAVQEKWCLPGSMAIMGGSFGGYCALAAMTFVGDSKGVPAPKYQCAVAMCPPSIMGAANPHKAFYGNPVIAKYWKQVVSCLGVCCSCETVPICEAALF